jgi:hypothetical protein
VGGDVVSHELMQIAIAGGSRRESQQPCAGGRFPDNRRSGADQAPESSISRTFPEDWQSRGRRRWGKCGVCCSRLPAVKPERIQPARPSQKLPLAQIDRRRLCR